MTEIEETLSRVLTVEADRHEPPLFNAHRIAGAATGRRRRWRPALFALAAAVLGAGGVGGAAVFANGGGHAQLRPQPTPQPVPRPPLVGQAVVEFESRTGSPSTQDTDAAVLSWVHEKADAEGLKNVTATVWHNPWRLEVIGPVADLDQLKKLGAPAVMQFPLVATIGQMQPSGLPAYHVTSVTTEQLAASSHGQTGTVSAIRFDFDDAEGKIFAAFIVGNAGKPVEVLIDGVRAATVFPQTPTDGWFEFTAGTSQQQIQELADILTGPGPAELQGATATVSTG